MKADRQQHTPNDGGPVHPIFREMDHFGMTLRDYFAAKALTGVIGGTVIDFDRLGNPDALEAGETDEAVFVAAKAYAIADAMLAGRATPVSETPAVEERHS